MRRMEQQEALLDDGSPSPRPPTPILPSGDGGPGEGDSSSAESVLPADAVSAQLINNITMLDYHSLGKTSTLIHDAEELGNVDGLGISPTSGQLPHFVTWNWPLIRRVLFWGVLSALLACVAAVVAMVAALPRTCNPVLPWYQGQLFYEIFPASFKDSNGDGIGDLRGLSSKLGYVQSLGARVVRLNSIFKSRSYPEHYRDVSTLTEIDESLGTLKDFSALVRDLHERNMSLVLDLPVYNFIPPTGHNESVAALKVELPVGRNATRAERGSVAAAIEHWIERGVDGFYIKGMENLIDDPSIVDDIKDWKRLLGPNRILMVSSDSVLNARPDVLRTVLNNVDLVDVFVDLAAKNTEIKAQIDSAMADLLLPKPGLPWMHFSVGSADTRRISAILPRNNTLSAILLNMMLPGTPSIFYGDEIPLREVSEPEDDFHESEHVHNLTPMRWPDGDAQFTEGRVLPWITGDVPQAEEVTLERVRAIRRLADVRTRASSIYLNAIWKEGAVLPNAHLRSSGEIIVVERWYPRKSSYAFVSNLGAEIVVADLSAWFYGGRVVGGSDAGMLGEEVAFKEISLEPAEVIVIKLEK